LCPPSADAQEWRPAVPVPDTAYTLQAELPSIDVADMLLDERRELTKWAAAHAGTFHSSRGE